MTNDELNRKVAEARGFTIRQTHEECSGYVPGAVWVSGGDYYEQIVTWCIPNAYIEAWDGADDPQNHLDWYQYQGVPDVCDDPAAWGAFHEELRADGWQILTDSDRKASHIRLIRWLPGVTKQHGQASDLSFGRALALAYLASQEARQ